MSKWKIVSTNPNATSEIDSSFSKNPIRRLISSPRTSDELKRPGTGDLEENATRSPLIVSDTKSDSQNPLLIKMIKETKSLLPPASCLLPHHNF